jgi:hypothetical protein
VRPSPVGMTCTLTVFLCSRYAEQLAGTDLEQRRVADPAPQRFVSIHTVKTQIKAIYWKLGVSSRNDAVQKAVAIGLLGG